MTEKKDPSFLFLSASPALMRLQLPQFLSRHSSHESGPRDVFLQLLAIIFLYVCVISLGSVFFQYINIAFPDVLNADYGQYARQTLRWPLAILVIVFPCYVWLMWILQHETQMYPKLRELKTRKWLLHLTVFLTSLVIVGDLITLVYQFLSGGLSGRFLLKIIAVLVIACAVFIYYGWILRQTEPTAKNPFMRAFVWLSLAVTSVAIVAGFFFIGSPFAERQRQFDRRRVDNLSEIQWRIINYWQSKEQLPPSLDALRDEIGGYVPPVDPASGESYEYSEKGKLSFQLCATFAMRSEEDAQTARPIAPVDSYGGAGEIWTHDAGRVCFDRTIDPDLYPPTKKIPAVPAR